MHLRLADVRHWSARALLPVVCAAVVAQEPPGTPDFSQVRQFILTEMGVGTNTPSLAVAVVRGNAILWEEGFGTVDRPGGVPATPHTLYYAASVTKAITATAIMVLRERGQLDLDRPANSYLRTAKLRSPRWNADEVTVRQVATHTAGLTTFDSHEPLAAAEVIRRYGIVFWKPGERFDYSNLGFGVLGQIITDVSGRSYQTFVHEEVLRPLGMQTAWAGANPTARQLVAPRYSSLLRGFSPALSEPTLPGASVLYVSAHELALFGMFHLKARTPVQQPVLSDTAIDEMQSPAGNTHQSLAWSVNDNQHGYRTVLAQGGTLDAQAWLMLVPAEKIVVVVLANSGNVLAMKVIDRVLSVLLPPYAQNQLKTTNPPSNAPPAPSASGLAGRWSGQIRTYRGNVPLRLIVTPEGGVDAQLGRRSAVASGVRIAAGRLSARIPGELGIPYAGATPYGLRLDLERQENTLFGAVVTYPAEGYDGPLLPFWTELRRAASAR